MLATRASSARAALPLQAPKRYRQSSTTVGLAGEGRVDCTDDTFPFSSLKYLLLFTRVSKGFFQHEAEKRTNWQEAYHARGRQ
jgi:hypothetical protein